MDSWRAATVPSLPGHGPEPYVTNTATGELSRAAAGRAASLYACGITPYDATHIGHAATYLAWDLLVRAWRDAGHDVTYVQNVTDVDDPLLERANRDGEDWRELAAREIALYRSDMETLRILPPDHLVGAVEALPLIEGLNQVLADRGALYELDRDVYFSRAADPAFGAVSHLGTEAMLALCAERGGDPAKPGKKDPVDPVVWLGPRAGEPSWGSPFGAGRPGWHVECAAIATSYLGPVFDVQAGGSDLIFPHHEFSASHARVAFGDVAFASVRTGGGGSAKRWGRKGAAFADGAVPADGVRAFARCYVHSGMVRLDGVKMSKSLGNLVFVSRLVAGGADPAAVRLAIMSHHYRGDWDWTAAGLAAAQDRLARWRAAVARAGTATAEAGSGAAVPPAEGVLGEVRERIADNLDAPGALASVDRWADAVLGAAALPAGIAESAALLRDTVDALLGVAL